MPHTNEKENCTLCHSKEGHYFGCKNLYQDEDKWIRRQKERMGIEQLARRIGYQTLKELNLL